LVIIQEARKQ